MCTLVFCADTNAAEPFIAKVNATEVNIRSGPSTNYYIVTKLHKGDRVDVREEDNGWYGIVPPPGCFSLISVHYVDLGEGNEGVVNGESVQIRAGSNRDSRRYAVQTKLNEGDVVEVLSSSPEGYLKIKPPEGAYIWIHGELVDRVSERTAPVRRIPSAGIQSPTTRPNGLATGDGRPSAAIETQGDRRIGANVAGAPQTSAQSSGATPSAEADQRSAMTDSTDRVAVYTWTGESKKRVRTTEPSGYAAGREVANSSMASTTPSNVPQRFPDSDLPRSEPPTAQQADEPIASNVAGEEASRNVMPHSTTRTSQFSDDSTDRVAVIKWNDDNRGTTSATHRTTAPTGQQVSPEAIARNPSQSPSMQRPSKPTNTAPIKTAQQQTSTIEVIPYSGNDPRAELKQIDDQMMAELDKPFEHRQFGDLRARYRGIMEADVDEPSRLYAERRIHQLDVLSFRVGAVNQMNNLVVNVTETRQTASVERSSFKPQSNPRGVGFAATGELRESMVFTSPVGPRRYRLIDPNQDVPRTLCYVEIPPDSTIDVSRHLGRIVGIRASRQFIETGNVDPIPILVASSIEPVGLAASPGLSGLPAERSGMEVKPGLSTHRDSQGSVTRTMVPTYQE
ncbi:MAG: SH3 domain-containing protein [Planctomycetes bacterium]|nr:SH3 domain-containing protein [Planctomycetota bacterium]